MSLVLAAATIALTIAVVLAARAARASRARAVDLQVALAAAEADAAGKHAEAEREREIAAQQQAQAREAQQQLLTQFKAAAADALRDNNKSFLQIAQQELEKERLKNTSELESRTKHVDQLVKPIAETLARVGQSIATLDKDRAVSAKQMQERIGAIVESNDRLRGETNTLTRALRQPAGRGRWGEMQLTRLVELAGLSEQCRDFRTQNSTLTDEDRRLRPDMVVQLPNERCVVIDSKAPIDAFMDATSATDEDEIERHLARHAQHVRTHVKQLAGKQYDRHVDGALADFVVLFLPAEHLFAAAMERCPNLIEEAHACGVMIASPTTLLTLLHSVNQGWREERLARNAEQIAELGRQLHERVGKLAGHFATVGKRLDSTTKAYNDAVASLEGRVLVTTRRFAELDAAAPGAEVCDLTGATGAARPLAAPELTSALEPTTDPDEQAA